MTGIEEFEQAYGPPRDCEKATAAQILAYEAVLPTDLLELWKRSGWCAYGDGALWLTRPDQFEDVIDEWLQFDSGTAVVFLRTAFAHLYVWHEGFAYSLDVQRGQISQVTSDIDVLFSLLVDADIQQKILRLGLFREVRERLGPPSRDECYAFVPALALGGSETAERVERVKMREHLALLGEIVRHDDGQ